MEVYKIIIVNQSTLINVDNNKKEILFFHDFHFKYEVIISNILVKYKEEQDIISLTPSLYTRHRYCGWRKNHA